MLTKLEDPALAFMTAFLDKEHCAKSLGIRFTEIAPGRASATMTVRQDMLNGHGTCHGGMIFTLADMTFGVASNSHGRPAVAQFCSIAFLRPAALGQVLTAVAAESILSPPRGIYDITVSRGDDVIAAFRGHARAMDEAGASAARR